MKTIGVVLAGGLSSRMHQDKSNFLWQGQTLIEHSRQLLTTAGCDLVLVSKNVEQDDGLSNDQYVRDRYPHSGPLGGIDACLAHILGQHKDAQKMLVVPVDMPLMTTERLKNIILLSETDNATYYSLGRFPLVLPISENLSERLKTNLEQSNKGKALSIKQLLQKLDCQEIAIDDVHQKAFYNCNTPEQWQTATSTK